MKTGCNSFCSYCIIPYARGRIRSREKQKVLDEIKNLVDKGIKEVVITGIHVASYGLDKEDEYYLIDLLEDINKIENLNRIRIGSLEPTIFTKTFLDRLKNLDKICPQFHLSIQSLNDKVLKEMNRKYNVCDVDVAIKNIRDTFENPILTADIIVGFPR